MATIITGQGIVVYQLLSIKGRFALEIQGMKGRGQSMYALCKERFGFKGNKEKVYYQLCTMISAEAAKLKPGDIKNG